MKKLSARIRWVVINGIFMYAGWLGVNGNENAGRFFITLLWILASLLFITACGEETKAKLRSMGRTVPGWADDAYDITMIAGLVYFGWFWSAIGVFLMMVCNNDIYKRDSK